MRGPFLMFPANHVPADFNRKKLSVGANERGYSPKRDNCEREQNSAHEFETPSEL